MTDKKEKLGIKDTKEVIEYVSQLIKKLGEAKADDGKISKSEILSTMTITLPEAIQAVSGSWNIADELKDLSADEKDELLAVTMPIILNIVQIFTGSN